ncbi:hypothetical protein OG874_01695 [Nocardia sp. NBC_00565]|uniref:hypothetical protein n=1 Tax=Nocardia sp. NBC_00565 TaxID=2975993 RepID=UPI002E81D325|nr:hypothetical protein [Nocardia sp. NBC_00565]WUC03954.1 hypothetical protein OG874_01695 [Nocardia sp. NBC_00565]
MLIWGWQKRVHTLAMITLVCGRCGNPAAHALRRLATTFTLFFIPLIPLSTKHFLECTWCGASSPVATPQIPGLLGRANAETMGPGQYQQPAPTGPNANWPQQPALGTPNAHWQQPAPDAPAAHWPQPALGAPNAQYQRPAPSTPNAHWQQQSVPGAPNAHWPQR